MIIVISVFIIALLTTLGLIWLFYNSKPDDEETQKKYDYGKDLDLFR